MSKRTCIKDECPNDASSRGLCKSHYQRALRSGDIKPKPRDLSAVHSLSDVDKLARTGICAVCGPVEVRIRPNKGRECMTKARKRKGSAPSTRRSAEASRRSKYGLSKAAFDALVAAADGRCQICDIPFGDDFHVDHCHETGLVRGLLCRRCNYGIGWMDDSPPRLLAAYMYLKAAGKDDADWHHRAS